LKKNLINIKANVNECNVLTDKLVIRDIIIDKITKFNDLVNNNIIIVDNNPNNNKLSDNSNNWNYFRELIIKNKKMYGLNFSINAGSKYNKNYCVLTLTIDDNMSKNLNCLSISKCKQKIQDIQSYLKDIGIFLDFNNAKIKYIEMNLTFRINKDYQDYKKALNILAYGFMLKKRGKLLMDCGECSIAKDIIKKGSFYIKETKTRIFKIYNKTHALYDKGIKVDGTYVRVEYILKGQELIERYLGCGELNKISDEHIENCFVTNVVNVLSDVYDDYKRNNAKILNNLIRDVKSNKVKNQALFIYSALLNIENEKGGIPVCIDKKEIEDAIDKFVNEEWKNNVNSKGKSTYTERQQKYKFKKAFRSTKIETQFPEYYKKYRECLEEFIIKMKIK